jgi:uncharacterized membrane protein YccC
LGDGNSLYCRPAADRSDAFQGSLPLLRELGAVACLALIPNLVDAPVLLVAALSLWIAGCIYFAVLDRTPRSYVFLLAGYSVALIGFPLVDAPDTVWDVVLVRVEEITLGIVCATVIGSVVFPAPLGPSLTARLDN